MRDVHDGDRKPQVLLVLRAGGRARARIYAIFHPCHGVRTAGNVGWNNLGDRLFDLSQKAKTYSPALQANIVLIRDHGSNLHTSIIAVRFNVPFQPKAGREAELIAL